MTKKIVCILVGMLLVATIPAIAGAIQDDTNIVADVNPNAGEINPTLNRIWEKQFQYDVGGITGSLYLAGCGFDGTNLYFPIFNGATIYQFSKNGTSMGSFTIPGVSALRDTEYDGQYVYGGDAAGLYLWKMDMATHTLVQTMTFPVAARSCAYDTVHDAFWVNVWSTTLTLVSRTGSILDTFTPVEALYGSAWDDVTQLPGYAGPFLWVFTGTSTGVNGVIKVYDLATKAYVAGVQHDVAAECGLGIAGGLCITHDFVAGTVTLIGVIQGTSPTNDYVFGYKMANLSTNSPPLTPGAPIGPTTGVTGVSYSFSATTTDPETDNISFKFDWGDGNFSGWLGPYPSGGTVTTTYAWAHAGTFDVKVKARDEHGSESNWSASHSIVIAAGPTIEIGTITGGLFKVKAQIKNTGGAGATNVNWKIELAGGLIILGKSTTGTIASLGSGETNTVSSKMIVGFGKTKVTVTADTATKSVNATVLLVYIKI